VSRHKKVPVDPHEDDLVGYTSYRNRIRDEEVYHDLCAVNTARTSNGTNGHHSSHGAHAFAATRDVTLAVCCF